MKVLNRRGIKAIINTNSRQPVIQQRRTGLNAQRQPIANVAAVRNPLARAQR